MDTLLPARHYPTNAQEFLPSPPLKDVVRFYQYSETRLGNKSLLKPILARPEQFLQFSFREPYTVIDWSTGARYAASPVVVAGRQTQRNVDVLAAGDVFTFTIHFQPTGFSRLFHIPLLELTNLTPDAVNVVGPEMRILHDRFYKADAPLRWSG